MTRGVLTHMITSGPILVPNKKGNLAMGDDILLPATNVKKRILAVDDDPEVRKLTRAALEHGDYEVLTAESGEKALEVLNDQGLPHLAIIDIRKM